MRVVVNEIGIMVDVDTILRRKCRREDFVVLVVD
jgi:hypothetical protein